MKTKNESLAEFVRKHIESKYPQITDLKSKRPKKDDQKALHDFAKSHAADFFHGFGLSEYGFQQLIFGLSGFKKLSADNMSLVVMAHCEAISAFDKDYNNQHYPIPETHPCEGGSSQNSKGTL